MRIHKTMGVALALLSLSAMAQTQIIDRPLAVEQYVELLYNNTPVQANSNKAISIRGIRPDGQTHRCGEPLSASVSASKRLEIIGGDVPVVENSPADINVALNFGNDSDSLSENDKKILMGLAAAMDTPALRRANFAIMGHTDATGSVDYNLQLSCSRAIIVQRFLVKQGVAESRLAPYGYGTSQPIDHSPQSARNRRVEFRRAN